MAAKIKDGLFIGDAETSQSEVFINDNKISNLINLSGREVNNIWAPHGLVYLTYFWEDRPDYKILNTHEDSMLKDIVEFIDVSISHGISVLLFSSHGTGRCAIAACIYLMMKYRWGFEKTYDYVYSKKPDINLNKGFIQQMFALDMKLLSARQKSFALKYPGSSSINDSGFKIEANMTINDISAMLPPNEAKRWNAWEPDYITGGDIKNSNSILQLSSSSKDHYLDERKEYDAKSDYKRVSSSSSSSRNKHANATPVTAAVADEETAADELLLVYSFLNSKNTITSLPGPYPGIYDIPKSFKIRFNSICFEEDVNWFPPVVSLPNNTHNSNHHHHNNNNNNKKVGLPCSALKGSRNKEKQLMLSMNSDASSVVAVPNTAQPKTSSKLNHASSLDSGASSKQLSSHGSSNSSNSVDFKSIYPEENIATISMNMNNNQRRERSSSSSSSNNNNYNNYSNQQLSSTRNSSQQQQLQQQQISNDLYEFVGITNTDPARSRANRGSSSSSRGSGTRGSRELITASTDHQLDIDDVDDSSSLDIDLPPNNNINSTRNQHTAATAAGSSSSSGNKNNSNKFNNSVTAEERLRNLMTDMQRHKPTVSSSGGDNDVSASGSSNNYHQHHNSVAGPSLYELATMKLPTSGLQSSKGMMNGAMMMDTRLQMADYGMDELLYAFDQQQQLHNSTTAGSNNNSNSSSNKANVIRARHDIVTHRSNQNSNNNNNNSNSNSSNNNNNNNNQYHNHSSGSSSNGGTRSNASSPVMTRPSPKSAWGGQGSSGPININPKTALPGSSSRPGSPSPGQTSSQPGGTTYSSSGNNNNHIPSRYSSPSSSSSSSARSNNNITPGAAAAAANSSNLSINSLNSNASGSNNVVGSGMNSATKVYRSVVMKVAVMPQ
jgi:protein-tyrosine phosphatase